MCVYKWLDLKAWGKALFAKSIAKKRKRLQVKDLKKSSLLPTDKRVPEC